MNGVSSDVSVRTARMVREEGDKGNKSKSEMSEVKKGFGRRETSNVRWKMSNGICQMEYVKCDGANGCGAMVQRPAGSIILPVQGFDPSRNRFLEAHFLQHRFRDERVSRLRQVYAVCRQDPLLFIEPIVLPEMVEECFPQVAQDQTPL